MDNLPKPLVSVVMITYKHENFIAEAIERVLMQNLDFDVELIIADDCSPDGTEGMVKNFVDYHPKGHWIKYHRHEKNIGMMPNFLFALQEAKGKYISLCEGDDYWTDTSKLKKQIDFLELNLDYEVTGHKVLIERNGLLETDFFCIENITTEMIIAKGPILRTCSMLMRNNFTEGEYEVLGRAILGDWSIMLIQSRKGKIKFLNETMGIYRIHNGGVYSSSTEKKKIEMNIQFQESIIIEFPEYKEFIKKLIDQKRKYYNLYDYSFFALVKGKSNIFIFLYGIRVTLNLKRRLLKIKDYFNFF
jgi:glycosyltransferase involved in cell wall biosynthesis